MALDVLLEERSVTRAARRLGLSPSAMSRTLARLRVATGDPLLVQAGRKLVPTPHGEHLAARVHRVSHEAQSVLQPAASGLDLATLDRSFTIRAGEGFVEMMAASIIGHIEKIAPHVRLRFVQKPDKEPAPLRDGAIDLEIGVLGTSAPELKTKLLFRDRFVGVARRGHAVFDLAAITAKDYAACKHVVASRRGNDRDEIDGRLDERGLSRNVSMVVPGYPDAMRVVRGGDLVSMVPESCLGNRLAGDYAGMLGIAGFDLPVPTVAFNILAIWHPRLDNDPAHQWLRETFVTVCRKAYG
jgi:DNA-binding transcriptional LysR family regulator